MARDPIDRDEEHREAGGVSRRGFLSSMGTGALSVAAAGRLAADDAHATGPQANDGDLVSVRLRINGRDRTVLAEPRWSLADVLRETLGLTGTKLGCGRGECGACTVLLDGLPRYACMTLAVEAQGYDITTIEGLMHGEELGPTQQAFVDEDAYQCGYCTAGQIMAAEALAHANPDASVDEIRRHMAGNLCRCGAYQHIVMAVQRAVALRREGGGA
ncbi:MAG: (2Fe-2S)-binding protein [Gemmatimonadales bacterium]|jgi:xanthine dehydrogenase YagT iron-sulfur-binding subunit